MVAHPVFRSVGEVRSLRLRPPPVAAESALLGCVAVEAAALRRPAKPRPEFTLSTWRRCVGDRGGPRAAGPGAAGRSEPIVGMTRSTTAAAAAMLAKELWLFCRLTPPENPPENPPLPLLLREAADVLVVGTGWSPPPPPPPPLLLPPRIPRPRAALPLVWGAERGEDCKEVPLTTDQRRPRAPTVLLPPFVLLPLLLLGAATDGGGGGPFEAAAP